MTTPPKWLVPEWSAPAHVHALMTTRVGGVSRAPYDSFNLGDHVGDDPLAVQRNRVLLREAAKLPGEPLWLKQVHGTQVVEAAFATAGVTADASCTSTSGVVLAVLTADCLPVFLCDREGTRIGLAHAGWRGLCHGVIEATVHAMGVPSGRVIAHLGVGIGADAYEVGDDVRSAFVAVDSEAARAFRRNGPGRWLADMAMLARLRLRALGVEAITASEYCSFRESDLFFSYRRDGVTGRMASLLWIA